MSQDDGKLAWPARDRLRVLNHDVRRADAPDKVSGRATYPHDVRLPGMLWARVLLSPSPAARVEVDVDPALAIEGVEAALPLTAGLRDGTETVWLGQPIAAVAARTPELAEDGIRAVRVRLEELPWVVTYEQATAKDAPVVDQSARREEASNVVPARSRGDRDAAEAALREADEIVEATYTLPVQHHACLETHGVVVDYRGGDEATVYASTQGTFTVGPEAAELLGLPPENLTVLVRHMGGGFGSKFGLDLPGAIACRLAKEAKKPIHLFFTRKDEFLAAGNRSGSRQEVRAGATRDGTLTALSAKVWRLGGVSGGSHPGLPYVYRVGTAYTETASVHTNTDGNRAQRAPGHPQASFAMESLVDELAYAIGMDPLEFRKKNLEDPVYHRQLDRVAREIGWPDHPHRTAPPDPLPAVSVGIGFGVSTWSGAGREVCQVDVRIAPDGSVVVTSGSQDLGTGTRTYLRAIVAEELGLPVDGVRERIGSSEYGAANASGGSTTVASLAPAVKVAAHRARLAFLERVAPHLETGPESLSLEGGRVADGAQAGRVATWKEACRLLGETPVEARGEWDAGLASRGVHGAQAAKVEVDTRTGEVRVLTMACIQDCGLPLNRSALRSQINGGMIQGMSYGMWEERVLDPWLGTMLNPGLDEYKIAGTMDVPELVAIVDDDDERQAVIGMGEPPVIPGQSAVANAVYNACGARVRDLPITRARVLAALGRV